MREVKICSKDGTETDGRKHCIAPIETVWECGGCRHWYESKKRAEKCCEGREVAVSV